MKKLIMIKYGELSTKKGNINFFIKTLKTNIENTLKDIECSITYDKNRMFIESSEQTKILDKLSTVFGIHEIDIVNKIEKQNLDELKENLIKDLQEKEFNTFKVITKRSDKTYPLTSTELSRNIGTHILRNIDNKKVDVKDPELKVNVELRSNAIYYYFEKIKGLGGYPVGTLGKGLLMLSGGIDSPVAGYLTVKRGVKLEAIYFESPPHTSQAAKNKVIDLAKNIAKYNNDIKLHVINFTEIQESIYKKIPHEYLITIMRRMMYRISAIIASKSNAHILVNGESIGQVASQTLTSMEAINSVITMPVIRPLACFDKLEIIELSKKIDAYETSILPFEDCCTIFVPEHPIINPSKKLCEEYEELIPYKDLIYDTIKNHEVIKITNKLDFEDLL